MGSQSGARGGGPGAESLLKLLLDEMLPEDLGLLLHGHEVDHVVGVGWRQINNGKLLSLAEANGYQVLITKDAKIPYQQNFANRSIALLVLRPSDQSASELFSLVPAILAVLNTLRPGTVQEVSHA